MQTAPTIVKAQAVVPIQTGTAPITVKPVGPEQVPFTAPPGRQKAKELQAKIVVPQSITFQLLTGKVQRLSQVRAPFKKISLYGCSSFSNGVPVANAQNCYVGWDTSFLPMLIFPWAGVPYEITPADNMVEPYFYDAYDLFVTGATGDYLFYTIDLA